MPELANAPKYALRIEPPQTPLNPASYFDRTPVPAPIPSTVGLSRAQGKAQLWGSIASVLSSLPDTLTKAYEQGNAMKTGNATRSAYESALAGRPVTGTSLSDFKATGDGGVTFSPGDTELEKAKLDHYNRMNQPKPVVPTLYERFNPTDNQPLPQPSVQPPASDLIPGIGQTDPSSIPAPVVAPEQPAPDVMVRPPQPGVDGTVDPSQQALTQPGDLLSEEGAPEAPAIRLASPLPYLSPASPARKTNDLSGLIGTEDPAYTPPSVAPGEIAAPISVAEMRASSNAGALPTISPRGAPSDLTLFPSTPVPATPKPRAGAIAPQLAMPPAQAQQQVTQAGNRSAGVTVDPVSGIKTVRQVDGQEFQIRPDEPNKMIPIKSAAIDSKVPALIKADAVRMNVWKDGMTSEQAERAMEEKQISEGVIPPRLIPQAQSLARMVTNHPALKHYPTIREAKETVDAGLANPTAGGFSDMALVEGFQRMVNPGASVRAQTMQQMLKSAGLGQYTDLGFVMDHFKQGDKFAPEVRQRLKKMSDDIFERATKNAEPQLKALGRLAKSYGISKPDDFVNNVMVLSPLYDAGGAEVPLTPPAAQSAGAPQSNPGMVKMQAPDGSTEYVKPEAVDKYRAKGAVAIP